MFDDNDYAQDHPPKQPLRANVKLQPEVHAELLSLSKELHYTVSHTVKVLVTLHKVTSWSEQGRTEMLPRVQQVLREEELVKQQVQEREQQEKQAMQKQLQKEVQENEQALDQLSAAIKKERMDLIMSEEDKIIANLYATGSKSPKNVAVHRDSRGNVVVSADITVQPGIRKRKRVDPMCVGHKLK